MKRIVLVTSLALALAAPALAQESQGMPPEEDQNTADVQASAEAQADDGKLSATGHSTVVYHGPHRYPATTRGRAGDPKIIDHRADTLIVEPTRSTITFMPPPE